MNYKILIAKFLHKVKTFNSSEILDRIRAALNLSNDTELSAILGIKKATLSNWRSRNSLDWALLFSFCEHIDLNWLVWGSNNPHQENQINCAEPINNDALIVHLDNKLKEKDNEIGNLREDIGRLKAKIEELERMGEVHSATTQYVHSISKEIAET